MFRRLRFKDLNAVKQIFLSAFREEYGRRGVDIGAQVERWKRLYPFLKLLTLFPNPFRYAINLHVWEEEGRLLGFIQTSPGNRQHSRWHIDFVAVSPEAQGRGIGGHLVQGIFEHYSTRGIKTFTLEVDQDNTPALRFYDKLGFRRYASTTYYSAPEQPRASGETPGQFRPYRSKDADALLALHLAGVPAQARTIDGRSRADFSLSFPERCALRLRSLLGQQDEHRWILEEDGRLVGYLRVVAQHRPLPHTIHLLAVAGREDLYEVLLKQAALILNGYPPRTVLAWASDYAPEKHRALDTWGLRAFTVDHALVRDSLITLKLPNHGHEMALTDDKAFKPAFSQPSSG